MGANGEVCDAVCGALGSTCNSRMQSSLTTNELVRNAFSDAGYVCNGYHRPEDYAGTPFSTGRGDDCAPMKEGGRRSSCTKNFYRHHKPLCFCGSGITEPGKNKGDRYFSFSI